MEYIDVINEETKLNEQLKKLEEKYAKEVLKISTRLERLTQHKEDFQKGNSSLAFAREYIDVDNPFTILQYFPLYIDSLKKELMRDYKQLLTHDLEIQDNAYGGDYHKYTTLVKKGYGINYHPNLGSINFSHEIPVQYFSDLMMELEKLSIIKPIEKERLPYITTMTSGNNVVEGKTITVDITGDEIKEIKVNNSLGFDVPTGITLPVGGLLLLVGIGVIYIIRR